MSYDRLIIAKKQPKAVHLEAFPLVADGTLKVHGRLRHDQHVVLTDPDGAYAEVDGPYRLEDEDVPDAAAGATGSTGWLVQLSVKPSTAATWPHEMAIHLARASDGVVFDPQQNEVTWPPGFRPRDSETGEARIDQIAIDWFTAWPSDDQALPAELLRLVDAHLPEALPRRYGGVEPLPHRFEGDGAADRFVERWIEEAASWTPMIFWTTTRPCLGGSASMSTTRAPERRRPGGAIVRIGIEIDGRALARDPSYTERVVGLFRVMSTELRCVYAAASVERNVILKGSRVSADSRTEVGPLPRSDRWVGLPASPTWLAWFGKPYAGLVRPSVERHIEAVVDEGLLIRAGAMPMNADELADRFPPLPANLIAHRIGQPARWIPMASYTMVNGPPSQAAEAIPRLTSVDD